MRLFSLIIGPALGVALGGVLTLVIWQEHKRQVSEAHIAGQELAYERVKRHLTCKPKQAIKQQESGNADNDTIRAI